MKDIYTKAFHVVIWLGKESLEDKAAFSILGRFKHIFAKYGSVDIGPENWGYVGLPLENEPDDWIALVKLFQRSWFQRIWVIQEAVVCKALDAFLLPFDTSRSVRDGRLSVSENADGVTRRWLVKPPFVVDSYSVPWDLIPSLLSPFARRVTSARSQLTFSPLACTRYLHPPPETRIQS
jgi:hypothetical protein